MRTAYAGPPAEVVTASFNKPNLQYFVTECHCCLSAAYFSLCKYKRTHYNITRVAQVQMHGASIIILNRAPIELALSPCVLNYHIDLAVPSHICLEFCILSTLVPSQITVYKGYVCLYMIDVQEHNISQ